MNPNKFKAKFINNLKAIITTAPIMAFVIQFRASSALLWSPLDMAYFIPQTIKNTNEMDIPTPKTKLIRESFSKSVKFIVKKAIKKTTKLTRKHGFWGVWYLIKVKAPKNYIK